MQRLQSPTVGVHGLAPVFTHCVSQFPICKMGITVASTSLGYCDNGMSKYLESVWNNAWHIADAIIVLAIITNAKLLSF